MPTPRMVLSLVLALSWTRVTNLNNIAVHPLVMRESCHIMLRTHITPTLVEECYDIRYDTFVFPKIKQAPPPGHLGMPITTLLYGQTLK